MQRVTTYVRDALLPAAGLVRRKNHHVVDDTVLILQPDHLGDIILSQPAVQLIRSRHPDSRLIAIVGPWSRLIASMAWPVDEIVTVPFPGFARTEGGSLIDPYRQLHTAARNIGMLRARTAYVLRPDAWWAAWLASLVAPYVVTADDSRTRHFASRVISVAEREHYTLRSLRIAAAGDPLVLPTPSTCRLNLNISTAAAADASKLLLDHSVTEPYLVIHPGSGATVKEWPVHRWHAVAEALSTQGSQIVVTGASTESDLCMSIAGANPGWVSLAGETSIQVLAEVLRGATIVLGPDCGPLHLAVTVGTPTVHLFGPSDPIRYGPWGDPERHRVISAGWHCPRCGDLSPERDAGCGCMLAIQPDEVNEVARSVLSVHAG